VKTGQLIKNKIFQNIDTNPPCIPKTSFSAGKQGGFRKTLRFGRLILSVCFNVHIPVDSSLCHAFLGRVEGLAYSFSLYFVLKKNSIET